MYARRVTALVGAGLLVLLTGCALFLHAPRAIVEVCCDSPGQFTFTSASLDQDGEIVSVTWEFGDGATGDGACVSHAYARTGDYCVTATVTDDSGRCGHASVTIHASREIHVTAGESIRAAIGRAEAGDTVMLGAGTYRQRFSFEGKAITVRSADFAQPAIIEQMPAAEPDSVGALVTFNQGEGRNSVLEGVVLRGYGRPTTYSGGAILLTEASPTIRGCTIDRFAATQGGGIAAYDSRALFDGCVISRCTARLNGGGLHAQGSVAFPELVGCTIEANRAEQGGGAYFCADKDQVATSAQMPVLRGNTFRGNTATGSPLTSEDQVGGGVHVGAKLRVTDEGNDWVDNSPYGIYYDLLG